MPAVLAAALMSFNIVGYAAENTAAPEMETAAVQAAEETTTVPEAVPSSAADAAAGTVDVTEPETTAPETTAAAPSGENVTDAAADTQEETTKSEETTAETDSAPDNTLMRASSENVTLTFELDSSYATNSLHFDDGSKKQSVAFPAGTTVTQEQIDAMTARVPATTTYTRYFFLTYRCRFAGWQYSTKDAEGHFRYLKAGDVIDQNTTVKARYASVMNISENGVTVPTDMYDGSVGNFAASSNVFETKTGNDVSMTGLFDTSGIKKQINNAMAMVRSSGQPLSAYPIFDTKSDFVLTLTLPEGLTIPEENVDQVEHEFEVGGHDGNGNEASRLFNDPVVTVAADRQSVTITYRLNQDGMYTLQDLSDRVNAAGVGENNNTGLAANQMHITLHGIKAVGTGESYLTAVGAVSGDFDAFTCFDEGYGNTYELKFTWNGVQAETGANSYNAQEAQRISATYHIPAPETTAEPTTAEPTTEEPTTAEPTTAEPTTAEPTTAEPTTAEPTTAEPTTAEPTTAEPTTEEPTTAEPTTAAAETTAEQPTTTQPAATTTAAVTTQAVTTTAAATMIETASSSASAKILGIEDNSQVLGIALMIGGIAVAVLLIIAFAMTKSRKNR